MCLDIGMMLETKLITADIPWPLAERNLEFSNFIAVSYTHLSSSITLLYADYFVFLVLIFNSTSHIPCTHS